MKSFDKLRYGVFGIALGLMAGFAGHSIADQVVSDTLQVRGGIQGDLNVRSATQKGLIAGGDTTGAHVFTNLGVGTNGPYMGVFVGSGAPTIAAAQGSIYLRSDGSSTSTRIYVNSTGSTTWVAVTTAS